MRKGLLIYKARGTLKNIGDYIQGIAAEQYTGSDVVYVQREKLHEYSGEPILLIMNGWFMHFPENWPPSKNIIPLFISFHINPAIDERMLNEKGIEYFKNHAPIGCRDIGTEKLLQSKGIETYLSGCLTLTLGKTYTHNPKTSKACFVDPYYKVSKKPFALLGSLFTFLIHGKSILKISSKLQHSNSLGSLLKTLSFFRAYSRFFEKSLLVNADYINHSVLETSFKNEESKFEYARNLLRKYSETPLVVTSRIHAALPCLAMGTPVIFVVSDDLRPNGEGIQPNAKGRFEGLIEFFNVMEFYNFKLKPILGFEISQKIGIHHNVRNKQLHLKIAQDLDSRCSFFMDNSELHKPYPVNDGKMEV
jgi:hypothetical protein